jgi:hypothetical protein
MEGSVRVRQDLSERAKVVSRFRFFGRKDWRSTRRLHK